MAISLEKNSPLIINFTPSGMVPTKQITPYVPISPAEIIEEVHEAYGVGITIVHLHAREDDGFPSYSSAIYNRIFEGIEKHCPDLIICASLSGRHFPELEKRSEVLSLKPDMASLTLGSFNFPLQANINSPDMIIGLIEAMKMNGVQPELECFNSGMINYSKYLILKGLLKEPYYYNILLGNISTTQADMSYIGLMVRDLPENSYWSLAGIGKEQLKMNTLSIAFGGGVRVGLEDNIWFDVNRKILAKNIDLVKRIHVLAGIFERDLMKPKDFGELGFYNKQRRRLTS